MPELKYDLVKPLVLREDMTGTTLNVIFECPVSNEQIKSSTNIAQSVGDDVKRQLKRSVWQNMRWGLSRMMYGMFGYGVGGALASTVTDTAASIGDARSFKPTKAQLESAVVDAFKSVQARFVWDKSGNRFVSAKVFKELQTEFAILTANADFSTPFDRAVLARMLAEVAKADGELGEEERNFFAAFTAEEGSPDFDKILERPPLTKADLAETSAGARHAMFAMTAAMAFSDETLDAAESKKLAFFATALGIAEKDRTKLIEWAKDYLVDQVLEGAYADGSVDGDEQSHIYQLAANLGVPDERVERLDVRCRKRRGIY